MATGAQAGWVRSAVASTTTEMFVAQEMVKPRRLERSSALRTRTDVGPSDS